MSNNAHGRIATHRLPRSPSKLKTFTLYTTGTLATLYAIDTFAWDSTGKRTLRAITTLSMIGIDYKLNFKENKDVLKLHERNADRLFNLLNENKGLYIKFGQNLANQAAILPKPFQDKFALLYDSAGTDPWHKVEKILKEDLGDEYSDQFIEFDKEPIASASIAQVHRAQLKSGDKVAVKVQHYYIQKQISADLWTYRAFVNLFSWAFEIPFGFMGHYISERLQEEVDFNIELQNGEKTRQLINNDNYLKDKVHVPIVYKDLSSKRVLIAEWCEGEPLFRYDDLKTKYNTKEIMKDYLTLFSKMIFQWGFVHSDPHPGNLLVRYSTKGKGKQQQQLVLLDHGLYVTFSEELRHEYCSLWKALFELNQKELKRIAKHWGIGDKQSDMFGSFALLKPYHNSKEKLAKMTRFEREEFMRDSFKNFFQNTEKFPLEMIFLGRTMRMLQTLNQKYHAPINRINLFTKEAIAGYYLNPPNVQKMSTITKTEQMLRYSIFLVIMTISDVSFYISKITQWAFGTKNMEDLLQAQLNSELREMGVENPDIDILSG